MSNKPTPVDLAIDAQRACMTQVPDLRVHPGDAQSVKRFAAKLQRKREEKALAQLFSRIKWDLPAGRRHTHVLRERDGRIYRCDLPGWDVQQVADAFLHGYEAGPKDIIQFSIRDAQGKDLGYFSGLANKSANPMGRLLAMFYELTDDLAQAA